MSSQRKVLVVLVLLILIVAAGPIKGRDPVVEDRETIYGLLDHSGKPTEVVVVDWLRIRGRGRVTVVDPCDLLDVRNIKGPEQPTAVRGGLSWQADCANGFHDIFYSGRTGRALPLSVNIAYILNGKTVTAKEAAGAAGDLIVRITITNNLRTTEALTYKDSDGRSRTSREQLIVPMAVTVSTDIPSQRFSRIEAPEATAAATGATLKINWVVFPYPTTRLELRLTGREINLEPIYFAAAPKMPPIPELDIAGRLPELAAGIDRMDGGLDEVEEGLISLIDGHKRLQAGVDALRAGVVDLGLLNQAHQQIVERIVAGLEGMDLDVMSSSLGRLGEFTDGLEQLDGGIADLQRLNEAHQRIVASIRDEIAGVDPDELSDGVKVLSDLAEDLEDADSYLGRAAADYTAQTAVAAEVRERQDEILKRLDALARNNPSLRQDSGFEQLRDLAAEQRSEIDGLISGGRYDGERYAGMNRTGLVLRTLADKMHAGREAAVGLGATLGKVGNLAKALTRLSEALRVLAGGGRLEGRDVPGLDRAGEGLAAAGEGVQAMRAGIEAAGGQRGWLDKARDALDLLRTALTVLLHGGRLEGREVPGLDAAGDGLDQVRGGLDELADGLVQTADGTVRTKDGVVRVRTEGVREIDMSLNTALTDLNKAEAVEKAVAAKVNAYDHFIGKPAGAVGEVRFLLRTEALRP